MTYTEMAWKGVEIGIPYLPSEGTFSTTDHVSRIQLERALIAQQALFFILHPLRLFLVGDEGGGIE